MGEQAGYLPFPKDFETTCIHHTENVNNQKCDQLLTPILASSFSKPTENKMLEKYGQGRLSNPTRSVLEKLLALLSKAKYGFCFSSGVGAIAAVLALLRPGDHIVCSDDVSACTSKLFGEMARRNGIGTSYVDFYRMDNVEPAIKSETKLIWTENPTNPKLKVIDLTRTMEIAKKNNILVATDNSFLTPFLQRPLALGVDVSVLSLSKYMNGHNDVIMGSVCTNREDLYCRLKYIQTNFGHVPSPLDCYQVIRGLKTLPLRMKTHHSSSLEIARYMSCHPKIEEVHYPGLRTHPQHQLYKSQTSGCNGMISFYLKGGKEESLKFMSNLDIFLQAVGAGGNESVVQVPSLCSHAYIPGKLKDSLCLTDNFIQLSVGLESTCDLVNAIERSLQKLY